MHVGLAVPHQHIRIATEYDVITMRQEVRQLARTLGLGLAEQAKIATAMSTVARALLARNRGAVFMLQTTGQEAQTVLEIACVLGSASMSGGQLEQMWNLADIRLLVDEVILSYDSGEAVLRMRMRLARPTQG